MTTASPAAAPQSFRQVYLLGAVVFIDAVGANIIVPLLPFYALHFGAAADRVTLLNVIYAGMALLAAPHVGRLADRFGRKRVLTLTLAGSALCYLGFAVSTELWQLFLFRALGGIMAAQISVAQAFVADVTDRASRPRAMGFLNASIGAGYILGPLLGAAFSGRDSAPDFRSPFLAAAAAALIALLAALVLLPAGRPAAARSGGPAVAASPFRLLRDANLLHLFPLFFALAYAMHLSLSILPLWMHARFDFGPREVGYVMALSGVATVLVQAVLVGPVTQKFGIETAFRGGVLVVLAGVAVVPFLPNLAALGLNAFLFAAALGIANSSGHAMVSLRAAPERAGQMLGLNQSVRGVGQVASPLIGGLLFAQISLNAPYAVGAAVIISCALLSVVLAPRQPARVADDPAE